jgi:hypothetical protein
VLCGATLMTKAPPKKNDLGLRIEATRMKSLTGRRLHPYGLLRGRNP